MKKDKKALKDLENKSKGFLAEFKKFIARGNVMDLAVGVIVGTAFTNIVTSLSNNILLPIVGILIGGFNFKKLTLKLNLWGKNLELHYGEFIQSMVDFLITAFVVFLIIKILNKIFAKKEEAKKEEPPKPKSEEVLLLEEIRDLLKKDKQN